MERKRPANSGAAGGQQKLSPEEVLSHIAYGILVTDLRGTILYWNEGCKKLFGYSSNEITGSNASQLYPVSNRFEFTAGLDRVINNEVMSGQWLGRRKDGSRLWIHGESKLIVSDEGEARGIVTTVRDIDSQRQTEKKLEESLARTQAILETTVDGIITINTSGIILSINSAVEQIFGYSSDELTGQNIHILMPSPYQENHNRYLKNYLESGERKIIGIGREVRGRRKDGTTFPMELAVSELEWDGKRIFTGSIKDISARRTLENEIIKISDEERRRIGQDLHDGLGQMLTGITLMSQSLARKLEEDHIPASRNLNELTDLIKEADKYARTLSHSLVPVEIDSTGLKIALSQLCERAGRLFNIQCDFSSDNADEVKDGFVANHLYRIVQESISNAVKHGKASGISVHLSCTANHIALLIEDDGAGFDVDDPEFESRGLGIKTMKYRAHISGGELKLLKNRNGFILVECIIPLDENS